MCTETTRDRLLKLLEILSSQIKMSGDTALFYVALQTDALPVGESISIEVEGSYVLLLPSHRIPRVKGNCNYLLIKQLYKIRVVFAKLYKLQFKNQDGKQKFTTASSSNVTSTTLLSPPNVNHVFSLKSLPKYSSNLRIGIHVYEGKTLLA